MKKVIHSLDDVYQFLDPKVKEQIKSKQLKTVEISSSMSPNLYSRWKKGTCSSPRFSTLLGFMQNLGIQMILKDEVTVKESSSENSEKVASFQNSNLITQEFENQLNQTLIQLVNQFVASATLRDKVLILDFLIQLMTPED